MAPHFSNLLETAIFPELILKDEVIHAKSFSSYVQSLCLLDVFSREHVLAAWMDGKTFKEYYVREFAIFQDLIEWAEDEDEYLRKNLPSDMVRTSSCILWKHWHCSAKK